jgi:hypothetical protein
MLTNFKQFQEDPKAWDMYITGRAGTGKTTDLRVIVEYLMNEEIPYVVCAFTHKACGILRSKLPDNAIVVTLHSFLKKRPGINSHATSKKHIDITSQHGIPEAPAFLLLDEYSMVGERDLLSIRELQDYDYDGIAELKVVWLGDPYQLPPVGDAESVKPHGAHAYTLTHNYRRGDNNPLTEPIEQLVNFIEGADPEPLITSDALVRGVDIVKEYNRCTEDKVLLAYTNRRVQELNEQCQGRLEPIPGDRLFSPTTKHHYTFHSWLEPYEVYQVDLAYGEPLVLNTKFKTLEHLLRMQDIRFAACSDDDGNEVVLASNFGHFNHKIRLDSLKSLAAESNSVIETKYKSKAAVWSKQNSQERMARQRAKAWRDFMTYNDCVVCLDFAHAMTVHKSQGSTYHTVLVDTADIAMVIKTSYIMYLRLMYVAFSRATTKVITN